MAADPDPGEFLLDLEAARAAAVTRGGAWIYVSVDRETGQPINAAGFWDSEIDASLAAMTDDDADSAHSPIPIFIQNPEATW